MTYVLFEPKEPVAAEPLMKMQQMIEEDIRKQIEAAKQELRCPKRYFLDMEALLAGGPAAGGKPGTDPRLQSAVLFHNLGCHPFIQVYELQDLPIVSKEITREYKFCVCAPSDFNDPEAMEFVTKSADERHWGIPLQEAVNQLTSDDLRQKKFKRTFSLSAWIRNLQELLFEEGPAYYHFNMDDIYLTKWVLAREAKTVQELEELGEWPPHFVYRPRLVNSLIVPDGGVPSDPKKGVPVGIFHLNLNEVEIAPETAKRTCLMVLLGS